jgi:hypothetical protein
MTRLTRSVAPFTDGILWDTGVATSLTGTVATAAGAVTVFGAARTVNAILVASGTFTLSATVTPALTDDEAKTADADAAMTAIVAALPAVDYNAYPDPSDVSSTFGDLVTAISAAIQDPATTTDQIELAIVLLGGTRITQALPSGTLDSPIAAKLAARVARDQPGVIAVTYDKSGQPVSATVSATVADSAASAVAAKGVRADPIQPMPAVIVKP